MGRPRKSSDDDMTKGLFNIRCNHCKKMFKTRKTRVKRCPECVNKKIMKIEILDKINEDYEVY